MLGIVTTSAVDDKIIWIGEDLNGPFRTSTVKEYTDELVRDHADDCKKRGKEDEEVDRDYVRKKRVIGRVNSLVTVYRGGPKIAYSVEVLKKNLIPDLEEGQAIVGPDATDQDNTLKEVEKEEEDKSEEEQVEIQAEDINVNDVLCGKGSSISTRPGNQTFLKLAREKKNEYQSAEKNKDKAHIVAEVVDTIHKKKPPGRFLKKSTDSEMYIELSVSETREKARNALLRKLK